MDNTGSDSPKSPTKSEVTLSDFEGFAVYARIAARLQTAMREALERRKSLGHILLLGEPGCGQTTLAKMVSKTMGVYPLSLKVTGEKQNLAEVITNLEEGGVLFIENFHMLDAASAEVLFQAMECFSLDIIIGEEPHRRSIRLNLPRFTLIATATGTKPISTSLLSRFPIVEDLEAYDMEDRENLARLIARRLDIELEEGVPAALALSDWSCASEVLDRLRFLRACATICESRKITKQIARQVLKATKACANGHGLVFYETSVCPACRGLQKYTASVKRVPESPWEVLGVTCHASPDEIKQAFRVRMMEYHPDRVSHLGAELRSLALERSKEINLAYETLLGT